METDRLITVMFLLASIIFFMDSKLNKKKDPLKSLLGLMMAYISLCTFAILLRF